MRDFRFRAWNKAKNIMFYGQQPYTNLGFFHVIALWDNYELMQFTGLHDSQNREIWEGDILTIQSNYDSDEPVDSTAKVFFKDGAFQTDFHDSLLRIALPGNWTVEVIGNIYENPDLVGDNK